MTAVSPQDRREMIERELHGIDVELQIKRTHHQVLTEDIERLEKDRAELAALLE